MKLVLSCCTLFLAILGSVSAQMVEPLALYDDFNSTNIDAGKWSANQTGAPLDVAREIRGERRLRLAARSVGILSGPFGSAASRVRLLFANPDAVEAIKATVLVREVTATGCTGNPTATVARTRLSGFFFNTNTQGPPTPGDGTNDVFASAQIVRSSIDGDPEGILRVQGRVFLCGNSACDSVTLLSAQGAVDLGTMSVGERVRLRIQWDKLLKLFIFQRDNEPEVSVSYLGVVADTFGPGIRSKRVELAHDPANCSGPGSEASMEVFVNNVLVNASAAPGP